MHPDKAAAETTSQRYRAIFPPLGEPVLADARVQFLSKLNERSREFGANADGLVNVAPRALARSADRLHHTQATVIGVGRSLSSPPVFLIELFKVRRLFHHRHVVRPIRVEKIVAAHPASSEPLPKHHCGNLSRELIYAPIPVAVYPLARVPILKNAVRLGWMVTQPHWRL
jgi:hypothetical protein